MPPQIWKSNTKHTMPTYCTLSTCSQLPSHHAYHNMRNRGQFDCLLSWKCFVSISWASISDYNLLSVGNLGSLPAAQVTDVEQPSSNELAPTPTLPILPLIAPPSPGLPAPMPPPISLCDPNILVRSPRNPNEFVSVMSLMFPQRPPATIPPVQPPPPRMPTVHPFYPVKMPPPTCLHDPNILVRSTLNWFEFELLPPLSPSPKEDSPPLQEDPPPEEDSPLLHEDPESKSQNQSLLIPEDQFLAQHPVCGLKTSTSCFLSTFVPPRWWEYSLRPSWQHHLFNYPPNPLYFQCLLSLVHNTHKMSQLILQLTIHSLVDNQSQLSNAKYAFGWLWQTNQFSTNWQLAFLV